MTATDLGEGDVDRIFDAPDSPVPVGPDVEHLVASTEHQGLQSGNKARGR